MPFATTFSATEAFVNYLIMGIQIELNSTDIMIFTPDFTSTTLNKSFNRFLKAETA